MQIYSSAADLWSICPISQQVIGLATIIQNFIKIGFDLINIVNDFAIRLLSKNELTSTERAEKAIEAEALTCVDPSDFTDSEKFMIRDQYEPNIARRIAYIAIGCIRMTPALGTLWSIYILSTKPRN